MSLFRKCQEFEHIVLQPSFSAAAQRANPEFPNENLQVTGTGTLAQKKK